VVVVGLMSSVSYGFCGCAVVGLVFGVVVATVVVWRRERYGGLVFGFFLAIGFGYWILFGF